MTDGDRANRNVRRRMPLVAAAVVVVVAAAITALVMTGRDRVSSAPTTIYCGCPGYKTCATDPDNCDGTSPSPSRTPTARSATCRRT